MSKTKIEWTDDSWNPIRARNVKTGKVGWHCQKISPGCENCYAESMNRRLGTRLSYVPAGEAGLFLDEKMLTQPLRWRKPRRVFVCSMTDLFADFVPDEWIATIFGIMAAAPQHTFQVLTKRSDRMADWFRWAVEQDRGKEEDATPGRLECCWQALVHEAEHHEKGDAGPLHMEHSADPGGPWPLPNVWLGVSAEDQQRLDERVRDLLATPAAVRFVSAEPLLAPMEFRQQWRDYLEGWDTEPTHVCSGDERVCRTKCPEPEQYQTHKIDWVIVGGESGPRRRPMDLGWARSIRDQCRGAGVPFFMKQVDKVIPVPSDLAIREMPRG